MPEPAGRDVLDTPAAGPAAIRGGVIRTLGYVVALGLSAASAPILFRHLGVVDFGRYVTIISVITLAGGLADAGLSAIGTREYSLRQGAARAEFLRNLLGLRIVLSTLGALAGVAFSAVAGYGGPLVVGTALAGAGMVLLVAQNTLTVPLQAELRLGWVTAIDVLRATVSVFAIVALVLIGAELLPFLAVGILAALAGVVMTVVVVLRSVPWTPAFHPGEWAALLRETAPFAAATALGVAYFRIAIVLMSLIATARETGLFATSYRILEVLVGVPNLMIGAMFPVLARAARDDRERFSYAIDRVFHGAIALGAFLSICLCVGAPVAIAIIGGDEARDAVPVLRIQAFALLFAFLGATFQFGLLSLRRYRALVVANLAALLVTAAATVLLEPGLGARGAAVATVIGEGLLATIAGVALLRAGAGVRLNFAPVPAVVAATGLAVAAIALPIPALAELLVGSLVFVAAAFALRAVPPEVVHAVRVRGGTA